MRMVFHSSGTHSPVLGDDGANLAAALQTIREIGDADVLDTAVADASPGTRIEVANHEGRFEVALRHDGLLRPLRSAELSDGTLRYLLLVAALLSPRPPALLVLDEPETSITRAADRSRGRRVAGDRRVACAEARRRAGARRAQPAGRARTPARRDRAGRRRRARPAAVEMAGALTPSRAARCFRV